MPSNQLAILFMLSIDISSKWIPTHCLFLDPLTDKLVEASEPLSSNSSSCSMIWSVSRSVLSGSIKIMSASCGVRSRSVLGLASSAYCTCQHLALPDPFALADPFALVNHLALSTRHAFVISFWGYLDVLVVLAFRWMNVVYVWKIYVPIKVQQCIAKHLRIFER